MESRIATFDGAVGLWMQSGLFAVLEQSADICRISAGYVCAMLR